MPLRSRGCMKKTLRAHRSKFNGPGISVAHDAVQFGGPCLGEGEFDGRFVGQFAMMGALFTENSSLTKYRAWGNRSRRNCCYNSMLTESLLSTTAAIEFRAVTYGVDSNPQRTRDATELAAGRVLISEV